ncbi:MAG: FliI/YscN family ATPase [Planctomycetota bacterium]
MKGTALFDLEAKFRRVQESGRFLRKGTVCRVVGLAIESQGPFAAVGELCHIVMPDGSRRPVEVVGFNQTSVFLMPLGELSGVSPGLTVTAEGRTMSVPVGKQFLGRVVNGLCQPVDGRGPIAHEAMAPLMASPPAALSRPRITEILPLGVRAVDGPITCGRGQRIGVFGGSGAGKSTLLGMFAKFARSDVNVIALIGERGREVREFIERDLGAEGLRRSIVIVVTSDEAPLLRVKGAQAACAMAEYFRDQGGSVLLMLDSITRICVAQREIGLAIGEPPTTRGYTPSVFSNLPRLLERAGTSPKGSITGLFTILVEGDDMTEPVADSVRAILDGHIVLSRELAGANHYPAIDVLNSQSRLFLEIVKPEHRKAAGFLRNVMASYHRARDLLDVGAYVTGSNPEVDRAIALWGKVQRFLQQVPEEHAQFEDTLKRLLELGGAA